MPELHCNGETGTDWAEREDQVCKFRKASESEQDFKAWLMVMPMWEESQLAGTRV